MYPTGVQVVLAKSGGGLLFVTADSSFVMPFPWTAKAMAVSCIKSDQLAVLAESQAPGNDTQAWLHILAPHLTAQTPMYVLSGKRCLADKRCCTPRSNVTMHTSGPAFVTHHVHIGTCVSPRTNWGMCA